MPLLNIHHLRLLPILHRTQTLGNLTHVNVNLLHRC
jgi:hypothetical protein